MLQAAENMAATVPRCRCTAVSSDLSQAPSTGTIFADHHQAVVGRTVLGSAIVSVQDDIQNVFIVPSPSKNALDLFAKYPNPTDADPSQRYPYRDFIQVDKDSLHSVLEGGVVVADPAYSRLWPGPNSRTVSRCVNLSAARVPRLWVDRDRDRQALIHPVWGSRWAQTRAVQAGPMCREQKSIIQSSNPTDLRSSSWSMPLRVHWERLACDVTWSTREMPSPARLGRKRISKHSHGVSTVSGFSPLHRSGLAAWARAGMHVLMPATVSALGGDGNGGRFV